jgi:hypothetical protein
MAVDWKESARELGSQAATGDQARALLGEALRRLHDDGYGRLDQISTLAGQQDAQQADLDSQRSYAERVYNDAPAGAEGTTEQYRQRVGVALWSIARALEREQGFIDADIGYTSGFVDGLRKALSAAGGVIPPLVSALPWWVLPAVLLVAFFYVRRIL